MMDLSNNNNSTVVKTPEAESETPTRIQPAAKPGSNNFTNGVLKRHAPLLLHPVVVTYKECLKNHAATLGGHAVDGCGEFMPSPTSNPADPTSLKCAACGCHRNFHRREPDDPPHLLLPPPPPPPNATPALEYQPHHRHHAPPAPRAAVNSGSSPNNSPSPPPISSSYYPSAPHMLLALSQNNNNTPISTTAVNTTQQLMMNSSSSRKRHRTKFTQDQKDKMLKFAERVGWKMQKRDEDLITEFCNEIGVDKGVFKVWMHNNKNTFGKKDQISAISTPPSNGNGNGINYSNIAGAYSHQQQEGQSSESKQNVHGQEISQNHHNSNSTSGHALGTTTNGSSSSS